MPQSSRVFASEWMARWMAADDRLGAMLAEDHRREPYDVVVCQQIFAVNVARSVPDVPMVLDEHNVESRRWRRSLRRSPGRGSGPAFRPTPRRSRPTRRGLAPGGGSSPAPRIPTRPGSADARGCRAGYPQRRGRGRDSAVAPACPTWPHDILFVGAFFWPPNSRAARFLAKEVLPRVRAREPRRLVLCGKSPGLEVTLLRRDEVEVTGTVSSVQPYLRAAGVYGNALFEGAGSSLKVSRRWPPECRSSRRPRGSGPSARARPALSPGRGCRRLRGVDPAGSRRPAFIRRPGDRRPSRGRVVLMDTNGRDVRGPRREGRSTRVHQHGAGAGPGPRRTLIQSR